MVFCSYREKENGPQRKKSMKGQAGEHVSGGSYYMIIIVINTIAFP